MDQPDVSNQKTVTKVEMWSTDLTEFRKPQTARSPCHGQGIHSVQEGSFTLFKKTVPTEPGKAWLWTSFYNSIIFPVDFILDTVRKQYEVTVQFSSNKLVDQHMYHFVIQCNSVKKFVCNQMGSTASI